MARGETGKRIVTFPFNDTLFEVSDDGTTYYPVRAPGNFSGTAGTASPTTQSYPGHAPTVTVPDADADTVTFSDGTLIRGVQGTEIVQAAAKGKNTLWYRMRFGGKNHRDTIKTPRDVKANAGGVDNWFNIDKDTGLLTAGSDILGAGKPIDLSTIKTGQALEYATTKDANDEPDANHEVVIVSDYDTAGLWITLKNEFQSDAQADAVLSFHGAADITSADGAFLWVTVPLQTHAFRLIPTSEPMPSGSTDADLQTSYDFTVDSRSVTIESAFA